MSDPDRTEQRTISSEGVCVQVLQEFPDLARQYAAGHREVFANLFEQAQRLAGSGVDADELRETLLRKLGAGT